jgi:hypothetical protein
MALTTAEPDVQINTDGAPEPFAIPSAWKAAARSSK